MVLYKRTVFEKFSSFAFRVAPCFPDHLVKGGPTPGNSLLKGATWPVH
jgi:hypothetical protein